MNRNPNLNKVNQIILLSQNYSAHKKMINHAKSSVDASSSQRNNYHKKLINQHARYVDAVQHIKDDQLNISNRKICEKLQQLSKPVSKQKFKEQNHKSVTSRSFWNLQTAKQRKRNRELKQIDFENKKMSERISKSRSKQNFSLQSYYKQNIRTSHDLNIRSEFSQRSQSVLENLVYNDLKIKSNDIPFLPQLSSRQKGIVIKAEKALNVNQAKKRKVRTNFQKQSPSSQREMNFKF